MCGALKHYPICPECREHRILSKGHIRCTHCRARRTGRKALKARMAKKAMEREQATKGPEAEST